MKTLLKSALLLLLIFVVNSCDKNEPVDENYSSSGSSSSEYEFGSVVQRDFMGVITDQSNVAIVNATVNIGVKTAQTDSKGVFIIKDANVQERFAYIEVNKTGYLKGLKTIIPTQNVSNVDIILLTESTQVLPASNQIQLSNGAKVTFNGGFEDATGSIYTGIVNYSLNHIDPTSATIAREMPGMLLGKTASNNFEMLQTYGMLHVNLTDVSGNSLQIATGSTAEIRMPIPSALSSTAPTIIPLWSFDEGTGYWVEDGSATKIGNEYVGAVSHFSWWNCDINFPTKVLCIIVEDASGNPLANAHVDLSFAGNPFPGEGITNEYGEICGVVPVNETLTLTVYDDCGNTLQNDTLGPLTDSVYTEHHIITIPNNSLLQTVTGTFLDCNNNLITDGYVELSYGGYQIIQYIENGVFEISTLICNASTTGLIEGIDYNNSQSTGIIPFTFTQPEINLGDIISCNSIDEYITYRVDNNPYVTTIQVAGNSNSSTGGFNIDGMAQNQIDEIHFAINTTATSTYSLTSSSLPDLVISEINLNTSINTTQNFQFIVSHYGVVGDFITVNFSGDYQDSSGVTKTISGTLHVRRAT